MQYENYERKIEKIAKFFKLVFRHMALIIVVASVVTVSIVTLLATKGTISVSAESYPKEITYGESLQYSASAFLGKVSYEYKALGSDAWTNEYPLAPGNYEVRAVSKATIGYRYSEPASFIIKPKPIIVTALQDKIVYGEEFIGSADLVENDAFSEIVFDYNKPNSTVEPILNSIKVVNEDGVDVTACYTISTLKKNIVVDKRPITIDVADLAKVYDGTPLFSEQYEVSEGSFANGDTPYFIFNASITDVGEILNTPEYTILDANGYNVTTLYNITENSGLLTVTERPITIESGGLNIVYDGLEHTNTKYITTSELAVVSGHRLDLDNWNSIISVGNIKNSFDYKIFDLTGKDVTSNYSVTTVFGTMTVTKRPIAFETPSYTAMYDGKDHGAQRCTILSGYSLAPNHSIITDNWVSIRSVSDSGALNKMDYYIADSASNDVTENYEIISVSYGTLSLTPRPIRIETYSGSKIYDGMPMVRPEYILSGVGLAPLQELVAENWASIIDVKDSNTPNSADFSIIDLQGNEVDKNNYSITTEFGTLSILPRNISVITDSLTEEYSGVSYSAPNVFCDDMTSLADGDSFNIISFTEIEIPGTIKNDVVFSIISNERQIDVTDNYIIDITYGTITVTKRQIGLTPTYCEKEYNGEEQYNTELLIGLSGLADGHNLEVGSYTKAKNVGVYNNIIGDVAIFDEYGNNVTEYYDIHLFSSILVINQRAITIHTGNYEGAYDGMIHSNSDDFEVDNIVSGHIVMPIETSTIIDVGEKNNEFIEFIIIDPINNEDVTENYNVGFDYGILRVIPRRVVVVTGSIEEIYDAQYHSNASYYIDVDEENGQYPFLDGHGLSVIDIPKFKDVVETDNVIVFELVSENGGYINADNYDIDYEYGSVQIIPRPVKIKTIGNTWIYDADVKNCHLYEEIVDGDKMGFLDIHDVIIDDSTRVINVADTPVRNEISFVVFEGAADVTANYDIQTIEYGELIITKRPISISSVSAYKEYDATPLIAPEVELGINSEYDIPTHHIVSALTFYAALVDLGEIDNTFDIESVMIIDKLSGEDVTGNYDIKLDSYGTLRVGATLSIKPTDLEKEVDGTPLKPDGDIEETSGILNLLIENGYIIDTSALIFEGSQTDKGTSESMVSGNIVLYYPNDGGVVSEIYYSCVFEKGILSVVNKIIKVFIPSMNTLYDGQNHEFEFDATQCILLNDDDKYKLTISKIEKLSRTSAGAINSAAINANINNIITYQIEDKDGNVLNNDDFTLRVAHFMTGEDYDIFTVRQIALEITIPSITKVHDGRENMTLKAGDPIVTKGTLLDGHQISMTVIGEATEVDVPISISYEDFAILDENGDDVTGNYDYKIFCGELLITSE